MYTGNTGLKAPHESSRAEGAQPFACRRNQECAVASGPIKGLPPGPVNTLASPGSGQVPPDAFQPGSHIKETLHPKPTNGPRSQILLRKVTRRRSRSPGLINRLSHGLLPPPLRGGDLCVCVCVAGRDVNQSLRAVFQALTEHSSKTFATGLATPPRLYNIWPDPTVFLGLNQHCLTSLLLSPVTLLARLGEGGLDPKEGPGHSDLDGVLDANILGL